jgi:hypothetical protein
MRVMKLTELGQVRLVRRSGPIALATAMIVLGFAAWFSLIGFSLFDRTTDLLLKLIAMVVVYLGVQLWRSGTSFCELGLVEHGLLGPKLPILYRELSELRTETTSDSSRTRVVLRFNLRGKPRRLVVADGDGHEAEADADAILRLMVTAGAASPGAR